MATVRLYLDKRRPKKNGEYSIRIIVFHNKDIILTTPHSCLETQWKDNKLTKNVSNYQAKNASITSQILEYENILLDLERDNILHTLTDKQLKERLQSGRKTNQVPFFEIFKEFTDNRNSEGSKKTYKYTLQKIKLFDANASFSSIDIDWLNRFTTWMAKDGLSINTQSLILRPLRAVFNYAIDKELITNYPFRRFTIKVGETRNRDLSKKRIRELIEYDGKYNLYRDFFMLSFYLLGINIVDLLNAKKTDVYGEERLEYRRQKTGTLYNIKIEPEAWEIINKYPDPDNIYLISFIHKHQSVDNFRKRINENLKKITNSDNKIIDNRLTTYYARHSWATIASFLDIPKEIISAGLGHKIGSDITSRYINFDIRKVDKANRMIIDYINS